MPVIPSTVIAAAVIAITVIASTVVIPVAPIGPIIPAIVGISRIITITIIGITVVGIGAVAGSVVGRERNWEPKGKAYTGLRPRFGEERQSSDRNNEDNELLHKRETRAIYHEFKKSRNQVLQEFRMLGQGGVGEAASLCFFPRGQSEDASLTTWECVLKLPKTPLFGSQPEIQSPLQTHCADGFTS
jgi:hypothetical protein